MNSLVIVADATHARMFRTARTESAQLPVELVEIDAVHAPQQGRTAGEGLAEVVHQVAARAAAFSRHHFCNPILVVANAAVCSAILAALERELPNAHVRRVLAELATLAAPEIMRHLEERGAFDPWPANTPGEIAL